MTKQTTNTVNITERQRTISDFLDTEYRSYSQYVLENRAIPSLVDGLKVGARKILHAAYTGSIKGGNTAKLLVLSGDTMKLSLYAHGDASLNGTIITLGQSFKYNLNPIDIIGQSGSLRDTNSISAPRYLYLKLSKFADIWKADYDLLRFTEDEGEVLEPETYLPIIPTLICQRSQGIAVGYKFQTMSYNPIDVIDACLESINKKGEYAFKTVIHPYVRGVDNKNSWIYEDGHWVSYGKCDIDKDKINVTALPFDVTFEDFEKLLDKKVDKGDIRDWKNYSEGENIHYVIILNRGIGATYTEDKAYANFKLKTVVPDDILWVLDEHNKIKYFNDIYDLIRYFVPLRLSRYQERKDRLVKILENKIRKNDMLVKFIELVCKGTLKIRNRSKVDIEIDMKKHELPMELIGTPMSKCTLEEKEELLKENETMKKELEYINNTTIEQMYINDLKDMKAKFKKEF